MLSRRLLRVKVVQMVYAYNNTGDTDISQKEKELFFSISKSHELYYLFLLLLTEIHTFALKRIEFGKNKKRPTKEDLNPNTRFVDNMFLQQLAINSSLSAFAEKEGAFWEEQSNLIRKIFNEITGSDLYKDYMNSEEGTDYDKDKKFIAKLFEKVIAPVEDIYTIIEEQSIYWNDEAEFVVSMVIKTIKTFDKSKGAGQKLFPEFKDEEDKEFVEKLFRGSIVNQERNSDLIKKHTKNWDFDRVAFMDVVLMQVAITELIEFQEIPARVTLNEYIEIAKHYSTAQSGIFINGILDRIVGELVTDKVITVAGKKDK